MATAPHHLIALFLPAYVQVTRVTYSTCSIYPEEDEMVVHAALQAEAEKLAKDANYRPFELRPCLTVRGELIERGGSVCRRNANTDSFLSSSYVLLLFVQTWKRRGRCQTSQGRETGLSAEQVRAVLHH